MKPIGLQVWTIRDLAERDFFGVLRQLADIGYQGIELGMLFGKSAKETAKFIGDLGMVVAGHHGDVPDKDNVARIVDEVKTFGCRFYTVSLRPDNFASVDTIKSAAQKLKAGAELLKRYDITFCYHNHWYEYLLVDGRYGISWLLDDAPELCREIDVYWACNFNTVYVPAVIQSARKITPLLHIKDSSLVKGDPNVAVGAGKMNIPACIAAADPNVLQWLIVEFDSCVTDMIPAVRQSYEYLKKHNMPAEGK